MAFLNDNRILSILDTFDFLTLKECRDHAYILCTMLVLSYITYVLANVIIFHIFTITSSIHRPKVLTRPLILLLNSSTFFKIFL